jgi:hypothetical protein
LVAIAAGAGTPLDARADDTPPPPEPPARKDDGARFEVAAKGGYATPPISGAVSPFGLGAGGRLGLVISNVYLGAGAIDYLGGGEGGATEHAVLYGVEIGYGIHLGDALVLRPTFGVGGSALLYTEPPTATAGRADVVSSASGRGGGSGSRSNTTTVNGVYVEPGAALLYYMSDAFVGAEATCIVLPSVTYTDGSVATYASASIRAQIGYRF